MKFKVGDKVRVVELEYMDTAFKIEEVITIKSFSKNLMNKEIIFFENKSYALCPSQVELVEETSNYITTKEFIKLVEDMGYEVDVRIGVIFIKTKNFIDVGWVRTDGERCAAFNFECDKILLDIFYLYANTPLELREEKEQLYTLELPNNDNEDFKYYNYNCEDDKQYYFGDNTNDTLYQTHFTQKEIDELPNQELIKVLKKEPVK